jgi:NAD-dependent DNA ligase
MALSEDASDDYNSLKNNIEGQPKNNQTSENSSDKSSANFQIQYIIEPKYDGISIELIYIDGTFVQAVTR